MAKCPKCGDDVHELEAIRVDARVIGGREYAAVLLVCPNCDVVLGAALDVPGVTSRES